MNSQNGGVIRWGTLGTVRYTWPTEEEEAAALEKLAIRQDAPE